MPSVLEGLRVLDFSSGMSGSLATMILADYGADVVKVERPGGAPDRHQPAFHLWNRGKRSVVLDLKTAEGQARAQELAARADIVVESYRPGVADRLGMGYDTIAAVNPGAVYASISGFGQTGPYRNIKGYDGIIQARVGRMMLFAGQPQREGPAYASVPVASYGAACAAVQGILAALVVRERTGRGQWVRTSLLQSVVTFDPGQFMVYQLAQRDPATYEPRSTDFSRSVSTIPVPCKDGKWIQFAATATHLFWGNMRAIGLGDIMLEPRFQEAPRVPTEEDAAELRNRIVDRMLERTSDEWLEVFHQFENTSADMFRTTQEAFDHPQVVHNGHVIEITDPQLGKTRQVGPIAILSDTPAQPTRPAPAAGEHTDEVVREWLTAAPTVAAAPGNGGPAPRAALEGITILELSSYVATPAGVSLLADLGARVIKIEPLGGDPFRYTGFGAVTVKTHQGKESLALDLRLPEAQQIFHQLVAKADLLIHNFRPGVPERLGFGYETIHAINPRLVYHYGGAYGETIWTTLT